MGGSFSRSLSEEFPPSIFSLLFVLSSAAWWDCCRRRLPDLGHLSRMASSPLRAQVTSLRAAMRKGEADAASTGQTSEHVGVCVTSNRDGAEEGSCFLSSTPAANPTKHLLAPYWGRARGGARRRGQGRGVDQIGKNQHVRGWKWRSVGERWIWADWDRLADSRTDLLLFSVRGSAELATLERSSDRHDTSVVKIVTCWHVSAWRSQQDRDKHLYKVQK